MRGARTTAAAEPTKTKKERRRASNVASLLGLSGCWLAVSFLMPVFAT